MECKGQIYHEAHNLLFFVVDIRLAHVVRISWDNDTQRDNPRDNYGGDHAHIIDKRRVRS